MKPIESLLVDPDFGGFDLVATNPPFSLAPYLIERHREFLAERHAMLVLLLKSQWGQSAEQADILERFPPYLQARIPGRIKFDGPGKQTPVESHSWFVWKPGTELPRTIGRPMWFCYNLPPLPAYDRTWKVKPGTEGDRG